MNERMQDEAAKAIEAAHKLLSDFRAAHPGWQDDKTPVDELASWLELEVATFHPDDYPQGTYGFFEAGEKMIWLCRGLPETFRRFTLAHELGHAVLHHADGRTTYPRSIAPATPFDSIDAKNVEGKTCQEPDIREEVTPLTFQQQAEELLGAGVAYDPRSQRELVANLFAAELLMPLERVRALYLSSHIPAKELTTIFNVSQAAMLNRLAGLVGEQPEQFTTDRGSRPDMPKKQYDEFQRAAIEAPAPALIVAGPGSGKTSTLIGRADYLIHELGVQPGRILALTFSRKAAGEMQERLQGILDAVSIPPTVSTFHAFCAELLRTYGHLVGLRQDFTFVDDVEGYFLLRRLAAELPLRHYQNLAAPTMYFPAILGAISRAKDELVTPAHYKKLAGDMLAQARNEEEVQAAEKALEIAEIYALYQQRLEQQGDTDFGGLVMLAVQLLQEHPEVCSELQQKYQHILVDEFQDINRASGVLLRLLAGERRNAWVVGDANQAIYGFRGASPANIANFKDDYPDAVILPLSRNYRSRPDIVSLAQTFRRELLESGTDAGELGSVQTARSDLPGTYVTLAVAANETCELNGLVDDIRHKHAQGYSFRDIVVLCRTRAQARKVTQALATAELPVSERGGLLEQEHIKNLLSIVMLLADSSGMGILRAARQPDHPLSQDDIEALLLAAREQKCDLIDLLLRGEAPIAMSAQGGRSLARLSSILNVLRFNTSVWALLASYLLLETSLVRDLLSTPDHPQASALLADYDGLLQLARYYDQQQQTLRAQDALARGEDTPQPPPLKELASGFLDYLSVLLALRQDGGNRRDGAENGNEPLPDVIRVMTVHASKGLEFPIVYLPFLVSRRFPMQKRAQTAPPPHAMLPPECEGDAAHESGEACLFYVATTRARDHLVLSYGERYGKMNYKRSPYIDVLIRGLPEERITRLLWQNESPRQSPLLPDVSSQPSESFIAALQPEMLSVTAIENYAACPRRYAYSSIYRFHLEEEAYQLFWQATRETLDALQKRLDEGRQAGEQQGQQQQLLSRQEAEDLFTQRWHNHDGHTFPFASLYEQHGREVTELLRRKLLEGRNGDTREQLRQSYTVTIAGKSIEVPVDSVEVATQGEKPVKFIRRRFGKGKTKPAPGTRELLYAHASRQHHPGQNIELHYHNLSTGETFEVKLTAKKEQSLYHELEQAIQGLERHEFPPKPDAFACPTCPFYLICPA
ncbi:MAG TPA: UvrD-helicase domain-containing protein [Ktedonobacteraceae bacterium]|nr:UvrD-helicase domain-containing protein [Ktedonobacteraceae bacterium]